MSRVSLLATPSSTLAHGMADRAERHGPRLAVAFSAGDGRWLDLSYAELWRRSVAVAGLLRTLPRRGNGPRFVLIALPNGIEYVTAFYGCLVAGMVAVPFYPPTTTSSRAARAFIERLTQIVEDCRPSAMIVPAASVAQVHAELPAPLLAGTVVLAAEELPVEPAGGAEPIRARPDDLALLQYTSGSTTMPKGVMVSHANLVHNTAWTAANLCSAEGEAGTSWLPLFHDMGLIGMVCHPLGAGMSVYLTTPAAFVRRPLLWLETISRSRSCLTMAPNFAYDLCVRWVTEEQRSTLDLSCLRIAVIAAEPVRPATVGAFTRAYQRCGFHPAAMTPAYGMAENTLDVTVSDWRRDPTMIEVSTARLRHDGVAVAPQDEATTVLVGCGADLAPDCETLVVDPQRLEPCPDGRVGEIWTTGPSVAHGYWSQREASEHTFAAELPGDGRRFLRTGDLGVRLDGSLYVVGRIKDLIIQQGVNHYPQDVEHTAERASSAVQPGGVAAFTVDDSQAAVVVCELRSHGKAVEPAAVLDAVRRAVVEEHGLQLRAAALVRKGQVPRTTSGKVRRRASADRWLAGEFDVVAAWPRASVTATGRTER